MDKESYSFLCKLLETPSVSGYEQRLQSVVKRRMSKYADTIDIDVHGNLIAAVNPDAKLRVMLAGHCDQIGLMLTHIDDTGFLQFSAVGGIDASTLPGRAVCIHARDEKTRAAKPVTGVIGSKPVHLTPAAERSKKTEIDKLWIDIGARSAKEAAAKVAVGDPVTYQLGVQALGRNIIASPGCDDRVGVFVVMEALRLAAAELRRKKTSPIGLFAVSTVQEELGLRGAKTSCYAVDPQVGIAVDVTHSSDNPGGEKKRLGKVELGSGPTIARGPNINPLLEELLISTAKKKKLKTQRIAAPAATGTDANAMQITRRGVAAALVGIPNRYMHTPVELVDKRDLVTAAKLIAAAVTAIKPRMTFIPV